MEPAVNTEWGTQGYTRYIGKSNAIAKCIEKGEKDSTRKKQVK